MRPWVFFAFLAALAFATAYVEVYGQVAMFKPEPKVDFGPAPPPTDEEMAYHEAITMGPKRRFEWLGAAPCPIPGYSVAAGRIFVLRDDMYVSVRRAPFVVKRGATFVVPKGKRLSVVTHCGAP